MSKFLDYTGLQHYHEKIQGEISQLSLKLDWGEIIGANNTLVQRNIYGLIPGEQYEIYFPVNDWDKSGVTYTGGYAQLEINSYDSSNTSTNLIQIKMNQHVIPYYNITVPTDSAYIGIRLRATSGVSVVFHVFDMRDKEEMADNAVINKSAYNQFVLSVANAQETTNGVTRTQLSRTRVKLNGTATASTNFNLFMSGGYKYRVKPNGFCAMVKSEASSLPSGMSVVFTNYKSDGTSEGSGNIVTVPNRWYSFNSSANATNGRPHIHLDSGTVVDNLEIEIISSDYAFPLEARSKTFNSDYYATDIDWQTKCKQFSSLLVSDTINDISAPADCESFLFFTDPHLAEGANYMSRLEEFITQIQKYYNSTPTTFCLCGGDWLGNSDLPDDACYKLGFIDGFMHSKFKDCVMLVGNHDTNYQGKKDSSSSTSTTRLSTDSLVDLWYRREGKCYFKYEGANTTFYCFDTGTENQTMAAYNDYGWEQATWFANSLLTDNSAHIAIAAHILYYSGTSVQPLTNQILQIAQAFNSRTSISVNGVTYDYSEKTGKVEFEISGHLHSDNVVTLYDIPCILTTQVRANVDLGPTFDLILADYTNRRVNLVRVGSGSDRVVNLNQ